jgi:membrane-associated phospholipid phosphatase
VKTENEIRPRHIAIVLIALVLVAIALMFWADGFVASWINAHTTSSLKHVSFVVSRIGDWPAHVAAGLIGMAVAFLAQRRDWMRIFLTMLIACALAGVSARVIKIATGRARPSVKTESVWNGPKFSANYNAFPSGHTASSSAFFAALFIARRKIGAPFLLIPIMIAAARVLSGAHYLSDVIFAVALGIACAALTCRVILNRSTTQPLNVGQHA